MIDYTERIKIDGSDIKKADFAEILFKIIELAGENNIHATEFEILTAMAFVYFNRQNTDYVVLETGLGGRLDATNIIKTPLVSVITSIDIDHVDRLGSSIEQIAYEKAGIIKENIPIITLKANNSLDVIKKISNNRRSDLILADDHSYKIENSLILTENDKYELPLLGLWQKKNLAVVLKTVEFLNSIGVFISEKAVKSGLKKVSWAGRFQYFKEKNLIIDGRIISLPQSF